jgi:hypothetical protein
MMPLGASGAGCKKQTDARGDKALAQSSLSRHSGIHIQTLLDNLIYTPKQPITT